MKTFVTSDSHFGHNTMTTWENMPRRFIFENSHEMNKKLIDNWNSVVGKDDIVYHLGDFAFTSPKNAREILFSLNGQIHLIKGNHDKWKDLKKINADNKFASISDYKEIKYSLKGVEYHICMMHFPIFSWNRKMYGSIHFFGHCHNKLVMPGKCCDVGVDTDLANFYPINIENAIEYTNTLEK